MLMTRWQLTSIDALLHQLGMPADGPGMRMAQERCGASGHAYAYRLMDREQARLLIGLLRFYQAHQFTREQMDA